MTPVVHAVTENADVASIARMMVGKHIHRVIVKKGRKAVGIISALDVLRADGREAQGQAQGRGAQALARSMAAGYIPRPAPGASPKTRSGPKAGGVPHMSSYDDRNGGGVFLGAVAIVALGSLLGLGQNVMVRKGEDALQKKDFQRRSLSWIKRERARSRSWTEPTAGARRGPVASDNPFRMAELRATRASPSFPTSPSRCRCSSRGEEVLRRRRGGLRRRATEARSSTRGHIPGAVNLPYDEAATDPARLENFDAAGQADHRLLRWRDLRALDEPRPGRLSTRARRRCSSSWAAIPEWEAAGYPLERTAEAK